MQFSILCFFQDKFGKISDLLSGHQVRTGDIQFTASEHPLGIKYCTLLLAKKFIVSEISNLVVVMVHEKVQIFTISNRLKEQQLLVAMHRQLSQ